MKNLGMSAVDEVSGFRGTITGVCNYLGGYSQYLLTPKVGSDEKKEVWFAKSRVKID